MNSKFKIQNSKGSCESSGGEHRYPYTSPPLHVSGEVIHGDHLGREIGFPTANIDLKSAKFQVLSIKGGPSHLALRTLHDSRDLEPSESRGGELRHPYTSPHRHILEDATYFVIAKLDGQVYPAAGVYMPDKEVFEVHILDFDADIYGQVLEVDIIDKIRDNQKFENVEDLKEQIGKDIIWIRQRVQETQTNGHKD